MPTAVRLRDARARALLTVAVAASTAPACLPSKDLADYYAAGVGGASATNTPAGDADLEASAAGDAGAPALPASNPEVTPVAPPLDTTDVEVGESSAGGTSQPDDVELSDGGVSSPVADAAPIGPCAADEL